MGVKFYHYPSDSHTWVIQLIESGLSSYKGPEVFGLYFGGTAFLEKGKVPAGGTHESKI